MARALPLAAEAEGEGGEVVGGRYLPGVGANSGDEGMISLKVLK
jgi:hypothetical protein